jgi:serine/threonine-protein kinase
MAQIDGEMAKLGRTAQGPGHYALGRGHLILREFDRAIQQLDAAWAAGFQQPEVAYGMGLARLSHFHQQRLLSVIQGQAEAKYEPLRQSLVEPALLWLERSKGTLVDHPDYGRALAAMAMDRFPEADQLFQRAQEQAPWLYEAALGRCENELYWHLATRLSQRPIADRAQVNAKVEAIYAQVERIAPSDEAVWIQEADHSLGETVYEAARSNRSAARLDHAMDLFAEAMRVRPDSLLIRSRLAGAALQSAFFMLSTGRDPGPMVREQARQLAEWCGGQAQPQDVEWQAALGTVTHLWWVAAEADERFGRDPLPDLQEARRAREGRPLDLHAAFPLLIEAKREMDRGRDPGRLFQEAVDLLRAIQLRADYRENPFFFSTRGQVLFEKTLWLWRTHRSADATLKETLAALNRSSGLDPHFAYTYYHLPRVHALAARMALLRGQDPHPHVSLALRTAAEGVAINPANATLQLAAADAYLAEGQVRATQQQDATPAWKACRSALAAAERVNPKDYHSKLLLAELEAAEALAAKGDATHRRAAVAACHTGLALKGDEPQFRQLLTQLGEAAPRPHRAAR